MAATGGIVLCGGRSSRMGRAKAWLPWRGKPMVRFVVDTLRQAVDHVVVVAAPDQELPALDAMVVADREPGQGPLAGIREGLAASPAELCYVTSTDTPFLTPEFVEALLAFGGPVVPRVDGHLQTLAAVYPASALEAAEALLAAGRMRPAFLLEAIGARELAGDELPEAPAWRGFNTPQAYLEAVRKLAPEATARLEFLGRARALGGVESLTLPVGTLAELLAAAPPELALLEGPRVASPFLVSLNGRDLVRDASIPIGPGERAIVIDAMAGG